MASPAPILESQFCVVKGASRRAVLAIAPMLIPFRMGEAAFAQDQDASLATFYYRKAGR
jgi:hypothetical protein